MTIHVAYHHWIITLLLDNRDHTHKNKPIMFLILPTISWAEWDIWVNLGLYPCTLIDSYLNLRNSLAFASLSSQGNKNPKKATSNTTQLTIGHPQLYSSFIVRTRLYQHHAIDMDLIPHVQYLQHHHPKLFLELFYVIFWILNDTWTVKTERLFLKNSLILDVLALYFWFSLFCLAWLVKTWSNNRIASLRINDLPMGLHFLFLLDPFILRTNILPSSMSSYSFCWRYDLKRYAQVRIAKKLLQSWNLWNEKSIKEVRQ